MLLAVQEHPFALAFCQRSFCRRDDDKWKGKCSNGRKKKLFLAMMRTLVMSALSAPVSTDQYHGVRLRRKHLLFTGDWISPDRMDDEDEHDYILRLP